MKQSASVTETSLLQLILSVEHDFSRIVIADHDINDDMLIFFLEDKYDFKDTLDECLQLDIPVNQFAELISKEQMNSYEGSAMHSTKHYVYRTRIAIGEPITWYKDEATPAEQQYAREAMLKQLLTQLIES